jgi:hypothetical protein
MESFIRHITPQPSRMLPQYFPKNNDFCLIRLNNRYATCQHNGSKTENKKKSVLQNGEIKR